MKLLFPKQNYNVLSPSSSYPHISVRDLYVSRIGLPILLRDQSREYINRSQTHEYVNWDWGHAIPRKGIHKWDFPCSAVHFTMLHYVTGVVCQAPSATVFCLQFYICESAPVFWKVSLPFSDKVGEYYLNLLFPCYSYCKKNSRLSMLYNTVQQSLSIFAAVFLKSCPPLLPLWLYTVHGLLLWHPYYQVFLAPAIMKSEIFAASTLLCWNAETSVFICW